MSDRDVEDAPMKQGTARDALANRDFRRIFLASIASGTGRWMQNVAIGVFAYKLGGSKSFATLVVGAQLFPLLALSLVGGSLADTVDRRKLLMVTQAWQAVLGLVLAWQVADGEISQGLLLLIVFAIGIGQALFAPAFSAVIPSLVGRENLSAAIALNSMMINGTRVVGPVLGAAMMSRYGISEVFILNSLTYLIIIAVIGVTRFPTITRVNQLTTKERLFGGIAVARRSAQVGKPLLIMVSFSLFCLPFIGLLPAIAEESWGIDSQSATYGWIYASFGMGALVGAFAVATVLTGIDHVLVIRSTLGLFAISLAAMSFVSNAAFAFPAMFLVGLFYFTMPTVLSTFLQEHLADEIRGRVLALWIVSFGGMIAITNIFSGLLADLTSIRTVLLGGALWAATLAIGVRLEPGPVAGEELLEASETASLQVTNA